MDASSALTGADTKLILVQNFFEELKRLVPELMIHPRGA